MPGHEDQGSEAAVKGNGEKNHACTCDRCLAASSAGEPGSSASGSRPLRPKESEPTEAAAARSYVRAVLERYLWLPETPRVTSRHDRRCAEMLFRRGVPFEVVNVAFLLATARRTFRAGDALPPVRALHFFLPIIEELQEPGVWRSAGDPSYIRYLEEKLRPLAAARQKTSGGVPSEPTLRRADG